MKASWIIYNNHLALQDGKNVYHPNASDIYELLSKDESERKFDIRCENPTKDLPNIDEYLKAIALRRMGKAEDIAAAVKFLALDTDYITGQVLEVDGGMII